MASDESDGLDYVRSLLSYLPSNNLSDPPVFPTPAHMEFTDEDHALDSIIPDSPNQPYDMHRILETVLDDDEFLETQPLFAPNLITGFGEREKDEAEAIAQTPEEG